MLVEAGPHFELRVVRDGTVLRQADYRNLQHALRAVQEWRLEYEMERSRPTDAEASFVRCPECGDEAAEEVPPGRTERWIHCQTCGNVWVFTRS